MSKLLTSFSHLLPLPSTYSSLISQNFKIYAAFSFGKKVNPATPSLLSDLL